MVKLVGAVVTMNYLVIFNMVLLVVEKLEVICVITFIKIKIEKNVVAIYDYNNDHT